MPTPQRSDRPPGQRAPRSCAAAAPPLGSEPGLNGAPAARASVSKPSPHSRPFRRRLCCCAVVGERSGSGLRELAWWIRTRLWERWPGRRPGTGRPCWCQPRCGPQAPRGCLRRQHTSGLPDQRDWWLRPVIDPAVAAAARGVRAAPRGRCPVLAGRCWCSCPARWALAVDGCRGWLGGVHGFRNGGAGVP
jgi:hypothetical protein